MPAQSTKEILRNVPIFKHLTEQQLQRTATRSMRKKLANGQQLFEQGDPADRFYYVLSGQINLFRISPAGGEKVIEVIPAGGTFAEALMFNNAPRYPVGAKALSKTELISLDAKDFLQMLRESVDTLFLILGDMTLRLRGLLREIDEISQNSAVSRVAAHLLRLKPADSDQFELPVSKQILSSRLSVTPETFSRIIKQLTEKGIISIHGSAVTIYDRNALEETADACATRRDHLHLAFSPVQPS